MYFKICQTYCRSIMGEISYRGFQYDSQKKLLQVAHIFLCWFPFIVMAYSSTGLIWWISTPSGPGSPTSARTASGWGPWAMGTMGPGWNTEKAIHCWMGGSSTALRAKTSIVVYIMMNMIKYINTRACLVNISCQRVNRSLRCFPGIFRSSGA